MANKVVNEQYGAPEKHILIANDSFMVTLPGIINDTGVSAVEGKKIVKAGTPLYGDIEDRDAGFSVSGEKAVAVLMHDVDVTDGKENGTIVLAGCVDLLKLEEDVQGKITSTVKEALPRIIFVKGSRI